ncbi:TetR/AcrR family transcriptional regulator [Aegicerativicinus sediminis]|uniref:TetR/AcrR family transcriptional regulator n=1 Tax=Aegicerativicinus sediminis TaxID=2893202 RepID=UPI001E3B7EFE|nr:TetR/AcrR family transcriptional regulator [Aegicerativicinus sediminis]
MKVETRKDEIIKTASRLFKDKGYSAVTMRDLASELGIKAASLYNHIDSKQELLKSIILNLAENFTAGMKDVLNSDKVATDKLRMLVELHVKITSNNVYGMASLNNDWMHLEDQLEYYLKLRHDYENNFKSIVIDGIAKRELLDSDPEVLMFSILSTLRSLYLWIPQKDKLDTELITHQLSEVLISGMERK